MNRRAFLLAASALIASTALPRTALAAHTGLTIGAIRWDPWYNPLDTDIRPENEAALGPSAFQGRSPTCATVANSYTVSLAGCGTQATIDAEIAEAHTAGIDYWAYCWYGASSDLNAAWAFHQSSSISTQVNWCQIFSSYTLFNSMVSTTLSANIAYFQQSFYQKVLTNRPLVYLLPDSSSVTVLASSIASLRTACTSAGLGSPYIVLMVAATSGAVSAAGADAIATYSIPNGFAPLASPYSSLVTSTEAYWATMAGTGQAIIPTAITGYDRRPRIVHPYSFEATGPTGQKPYEGYNRYYIPGTSSQIAQHVADMVTWMNANATANPSRTGLICSWSEYDEEGSTLAPQVSGGSTILNAVAGSL